MLTYILAILDPKYSVTHPIMFYSKWFIPDTVECSRMYSIIGADYSSLAAFWSQIYGVRIDIISDSYVIVCSGKDEKRGRVCVCVGRKGRIGIWDLKWKSRDAMYRHLNIWIITLHYHWDVIWSTQGHHVALMMHHAWQFTSILCKYKRIYSQLGVAEAVDVDHACNITFSAPFPFKVEQRMPESTAISSHARSLPVVDWDAKNVKQVEIKHQQ